MNEKMSDGQIMAWYHKKILRIPHGNQHPNKRYLEEEDVLELFDGRVVIEEKVDGKLSLRVMSDKVVFVEEDMTGKNTVHYHVMDYSRLPITKRIVLNAIHLNDEGNPVEITSPVESGLLEYGSVVLVNPTIDDIHTILGVFSEQPSHFGSPVIEGLVIKNYQKQLMGKWINDDFEDRLNGGK